MNAQDKTLEELVGLDRTPIVEGHLAQNKKNIESRVEMLIGRTKQRYLQHEAGTLPAKVAAEWRKPIDLSIGLAHSAYAPCPACGSNGTIEGEDVTQQEIRQDQQGEDDWDVWVDLTVTAEYFSCEYCRLVLDRYDFLEAAGVPVEIQAMGEYSSYMENEYGND